MTTEQTISAIIFSFLVFVVVIGGIALVLGAARPNGTRTRTTSGTDPSVAGSVTHNFTNSSNCSDSSSGTGSCDGGGGGN